MLPLAPVKIPLVLVMARSRKFQTGSQGPSHPPGGGVTVITTVQELLFPAKSQMVTVIGVTPGPTGVPAGGVCEQLARPQSSVKHWLYRQRLGTTPAQPTILSCS